MALEKKDLGRTDVVFPESSPRLFAKENKSVKIAIDAGAIVYEIGFPLQESATPGTYEPWANASGKDISCFIDPSRHQTSSTGETLAVVLTVGDVHRDAVVLPSGETQPNLDAQLKTVELRLRSIHIDGLVDISL
jgi:hypothetical protein